MHQFCYVLASKAYYWKLPKRVWSFSCHAFAWSGPAAEWYVMWHCCWK